MSDPFGLEAYLHDHIPVSRHLGVQVAHASFERVRLLAPLVPNLNHRKTGFGGSISAVAILAGWSLLWCRLRDRTGGHNIVIQHNTVDYVAPVTADFSATCHAPSEIAWSRFQRAFDLRGRARIHLAATVDVADQQVATFTGWFVALGPDYAEGL